MSAKINISQELSPPQVFDQMVNNTYKNFFLYSHCSIYKEYIYHRKNIFNILHKIILKFGFKSQVLFFSANYLDIIFSSKKINISKFNIYTIALAALSISSKFCEIDPIIPELQYFIKAYNNIIGYKIKYPIFLNELKSAEIFILKSLNYKLDYYTIYDFNSFIFIHGILKSQQTNSNYMAKQTLEKIYKKSRYYLDVALINTKLCFKYDAMFLSIFLLEKSIKEILDKDNNAELFDKNKGNKLCLKDIMIKYFNIKYENTKQYRTLISDDETQKIFCKNKKEKNSINDDKKIYIEEKKENNYKINHFNKTIFFPSTKKYQLNFDINNLKNTFKNIAKNKSLSKESKNNKTSCNLYFISTKKKRNINQYIFPNTSRYKINGNIYKLCTQSMEKNNQSQPKIQYCRYTYNNKNNDNYTENKIIYKKTLNSSIEFKKKNINLEKYVLPSHKKRDNNSLNFLDNSSDKNKNNINLYKKKLVPHSDNYKTMSSFVDDMKKSKISYGIVKLKSNEAKKEYIIEYNNKTNISDFNKNNQESKNNYQLIKNKKKSNSNVQNIEKNNIANKLDEYSRKRQILSDNINNVDLNNTYESSRFTTINLKNIGKEVNRIKYLKQEHMNFSKEKENNNYNIQNYQKKDTKFNSIQNSHRVSNNPQKNKILYLLGKQNTKLNNTLKEINIANANNRMKINEFIIKEDCNLTLPNRNSINYFQTQKNYYHKIKYDKKKEEIIKNQQDKIPNIDNLKKQHEKVMSSSIVMNNNFNINIDNKNKNCDSLKYNKVYKKNKIPDLKTKKYLNIIGRNSVNSMNDTFYKTHIYTKTFENDLFRKKF